TPPSAPTSRRGRGQATRGNARIMQLIVSPSALSFHTMVCGKLLPPYLVPRKCQAKGGSLVVYFFSQAENSASRFLLAFLIYCLPPCNAKNGSETRHVSSVFFLPL